MKHLCYLTYEDNPEDPDPDFDKPILISALDEIGYRVSPQNWRTAKDLDQFDAVLIRSPWDYSQHLSEFLQWFQYWESLVKFINPPKIVLENIDKRYLFKLAEFGIPIIPSQLIDNKVPSLQNVDYEQKLVLKPVIGAGARGAFTTENKAQFLTGVEKHFEASEISLLLQPYLSEVDLQGEIAVVCCNGVPLHAVTKRPALSQGGHGDFQSRIEMSTDLLSFVESVQDFQVAEKPVRDLWYSRIDVVPTANGYLVMELELFEPTLFLQQNPKSAKVFAEKLKSHLVGP